MKHGNYKNSLVALIMFATTLTVIVHYCSPAFAQGGPEQNPNAGDIKRSQWIADWPPPVKMAFDTTSSERLSSLTESSVKPSINQADTWTTIAYQGYRGYWDIYTMEGTGQRITNITNHPAPDVRPAVNNAVNMLAFSSGRDRNWEIYSTEIGGSNPARLTAHGSADSYPDWSPDGSQIVFAYEKDDRWEIYRMSNDGSGQTRVTINHADDTAPNWSPDGSQIVWLRRDNDDGYGALWVMNADGSDQRLLKGPLKYLQNPKWSPDGNHIAFDYDADNDGFNELATIKADGSDLQIVYDANSDLVDLWMGAWSPLGDRLLFSIVLYVVEDDQLYLADSVLAYRALSGGDITAFNIYGIEMSPDWKSRDTLAPVTIMDPLPAWGPAEFTVSWHGVDQGPSGVYGYDVQVLDVGHGGWVDWVVKGGITSKEYRGNGGHTYLFRARAYDRAGNIEPWPDSWQAGITVESEPPVSTINPLNPYERMDPFVSWYAHDPGGSGVASYDVQIRLGEDGGWQDWRMGTSMNWWHPETETGQTYYFRVRARDKAGNEETWSEGDGNTWATIYGWMIDGSAYDNRGRPLGSFVAETSPEGFENHPSDETGAYGVYGHDGVDEFTVTWNRSGFGELPAMTYPAEQDAYVDVVMPPVDNVIQNWGFESGALEPEWQTDGSGVGVVTDTVHTGAFASLFECPQGRVFTPEEVVPGSEETATDLIQVLADDLGTVHALWRGYAGSNENGHPQFDLWYAHRLTGSDWVNAEKVVAAELAYVNAEMAIDPHGNVHVMWYEGEVNKQIMYTQRLPDGLWSESQAISPPLYLPSAAISVDSRGTAHVVWASLRSTPLMYTSKTPGQEWTESTPISTMNLDGPLQVLVDGLDGVHVVWQGTGRALWHRLLTPDGIWSDQQQVYEALDNYNTEIDIQTDDVGGIHFLIVDRSSNQQILYFQRTPEGVVTESFKVDAGVYYPQGRRVSSAFLSVGDDGSVHVAWPYPRSANDYYMLYYRGKDSLGDWGAIQTHRLPSSVEVHQMAVDGDDILHFAAVQSVYDSELPGDREYLTYFQKDSDEWSDTESMEVTQRVHKGSPIEMVLDPHDVAHFLWLSANDLRYTHTIYHERTADSYPLSQTVTIPEDIASPTLSFLYLLGNVLGPHRSSLGVEIDDGIVVTTPFTTTTNTDEQWWQASIDMSPWSGRAVTTTIRLNQSAESLCARANVDEVSLGTGAYPDLWVQGSANVVEPGQQMHFDIPYGNAGEAIASSSTISVTLSSELNFVSASPPPTSQDNGLLWELGDLSSEGGPYILTLTAMVDESVPASDVLVSHVGINTDSLEIETTNNQAEVRTYVGGQQNYLPILLQD